MEETNKLYRVNLKGMKSNPTGVAYGVSYVIAKNPTDAYEKVKTFLDKEDLGYTKDREMESIELIAEEYRYTKTGHILYIN